MGIVIRLMAIEARDPWVIACRECRTILRKGRHAIFVAHDEKVKGIISTEELVHCKYVQISPYIMRDDLSVKIFLTTFISGIDRHYLNHLQMVEPEALGKKALEEAQEELSNKIKSGQ